MVHAQHTNWFYFYYFTAPTGRVLRVGSVVR